MERQDDRAPEDAVEQRSGRSFIRLWALLVLAALGLGLAVWVAAREDGLHLLAAMAVLVFGGAIGAIRLTARAARVGRGALTGAAVGSALIAIMVTSNHWAAFGSYGSSELLRQGQFQGVLVAAYLALVGGAGSVMLRTGEIGRQIAAREIEEQDGAGR